MKPLQLFTAVLVLGLMISVPPSRADCPLEESGHWGGTVNELIDHDGLLYASIGRRLDVILPENPGYPRRIAQLTFPDQIRALAIEGHKAFVVSGQSLSVVDMSLPDQPRVVAELSPLTFGVDTSGAAVQDGFLYCIDSNINFEPGTITVVNTTTNSPQVVGSVNTPAEAREFAAISATHLYLQREGGGLLAFDLASPTNPALVGELLVTERVLCLDFRGDAPVAGIDGRGLVTLDLSDPVMPLIVAQTGAIGDVDQIRARDTRVIAGQDFGHSALGFFSIADPAAPHLIERRQGDVGNRHVVIGDNYVATARDIQDIHFYANPLPRVFYDGGRYFEAHWMMGDIATDNEYLYVPSNDVLKIVRACGTAEPETAAIYTPRPWLDIPGFTSPDIIQHVYVANGYAYLTTWGRGLCVIDVRNPLAPQLLLETGDPVWFLRIRDGLAYGITDDEFRIYDLANPRLPALIGRLETLTGAQFDVERGVACFVSHGELRVLDVSDPTAPRLTGSAPLSYISDIAIHGRMLYVADYQDRMEAFDLSDLAHPIRVNLRGELFFAQAGSVQVRDGLLYAGERNGLSIWDLADPREPRRVAGQATRIGTAEAMGLLRDCSVLFSRGAGASVISINLPGDINGDHVVDLTDLGLLLSLFGQFVGGGPGNGDFNCDGWVDLADLTTLLSTFGARR